MADWIEAYIETTWYGSAEGGVDRLFKEYEAGRISRRYLLGLFGMSEEGLNAAIRQREGVQRNEGARARDPRGPCNGVPAGQSGGGGR